MYNLSPLPLRHALTNEFNAFFGRLNPGIFRTTVAASLHGRIRDTIESPYAPSARLQPKTFLQGSYSQKTATNKINDVDIVVLCQSQSTSQIQPGMGFVFRHFIFKSISDTLLQIPEYRGKIQYTNRSMCIKVNLGIKIEILPVIFQNGITNFDYEPFALFRPGTGLWQPGYARLHQEYLTMKNGSAHGNFIPMVKVLKHLRDHWRIHAVSFHMESLLYNLPDHLFEGSPVDYIPRILQFIATYSVRDWINTACKTPCGDRSIINQNEWNPVAFWQFHANVTKWARIANMAAAQPNRRWASALWRQLLGPHFPIR